MEKHTRSYLQLIKPGITLSNTLTAAASALLASAHFGFSLTAIMGAIVGVALIVASACVVNNMTDRRLDARMKRTKGREIPAGHIPLTASTVYAIVLGLAGFGALIIWTNWLTVALGAAAFIWYTIIYAIAKRTTPLSTIIGGVCGALPPVAGYVAVAGQIDVASWVLFGLLMVWQLPHFYAISIFRQDDYKRAGLPVWSVRYGADSAKLQILVWIFAFASIVPLLSVIRATGIIYLVVMMVVSLYWVLQAVYYYGQEPTERWAKRMFGISLLVLLVLCAMIAIGGYLP